MLDGVKMHELVTCQRVSFDQEGFPDLNTRIDRLDRLLSMLKKYDRQICETVAEDFGGRAYELSRMAEVFLTLEQAKGAITNVSKWMRPERRAGKSGSSSSCTRLLPPLVRPEQSLRFAPCPRA